MSTEMLIDESELDEEMMTLVGSTEEEPLIEPTTSSQAYLEFLNIDDIVKDDDWNTRSCIIPLNIRELADSIAQNGLIQPVVCAPRPDGKFGLVAGFRRFHAHLLLRREGRLPSDKIKAVIDPALVDPVKAMLHNLSENLQRQDLNILEEALAIKRLKDKGESRESVAAKIGMSAGWVQERFMVLDLPTEIQAEAAMGWISSPILRQIYTVFRKKGRVAACEAVKKAKEHRKRGEKLVLIKRKGNILRKKKRNHDEIVRMKKFVYDKLGPSYFTVALAWADGNISDYECLLHIREMARAQGVEFVVPEQDNYDADTFGTLPD